MIEIGAKDVNLIVRMEMKTHEAGKDESLICSDSESNRFFRQLTFPVPGDYDGDGQIDPAVFRPSTGTWFILRSTEGLQIVSFGSPGDMAVPNAYVR